MDDHIQALAEAAARQLLQRYREEHPKWTGDRTPVEEMASWLGLQVATFHQDDYPEGTYGWLEPGEDLIWLCQNLSEQLRRFTLAHELGHVVLHRQGLVGGRFIVSPQFITSLSSSREPFSLPSTEVEVSRFVYGRGEAGPHPGTCEDPCQELDVREEVAGPLDQEYMEELLGVGQVYDPRSQRELAANIFAAELLMPRERVRSLYVQEGVAVQKLASIFDVSQGALLNRLAGLLRESGQERTNSQALLPVEQASPSPKKQYDEFQQAAIEARTPALIVAGPGSGKTSTLIGRVEYLIDTLGVQPEHILALTFSRKAAQEMQERLQQVLPEQGKREGEEPGRGPAPPLLYTKDEESSSVHGRGGAGPRPGTTGLSPGELPTVSTFHAFCAELLRKYGEMVGLRSHFTFVDDVEGYFLLRRLAAELPLRHYQNLAAPTLHFPTILSAISRAKDELVSPVQYRQLAERMLEQAHDEDEVLRAEKALEIADIYAVYQAGLERQGDVDFGGLIMLAVQLLQEHPEVREELQQKYQHILVDEFQDINRASGVLLRLLAGEQRCVWVVGDANQAIYGFRGASPANIANFQDDYPDAVILPLSRNYRSRPDIVSLADAFRWKQLEASQNVGARVDPSRLVPALATPQNVGTSPSFATSTARTTSPEAYVTLAVAKDEAGELNGLGADIFQKLEQGYAYRDIVVLCRTRAQVRKITRALTLAGFPVIERGGMLEQEHIKDLLSIVLLVADPSGKGLLRAARQKEHPFSQKDIEALLLEARKKEYSPGLLILRNEAPLGISAEGRRSLARLSNILQVLQRTRTVWELLAQYLFVETSLARDVLSTIDMASQGEDHSYMVGARLALALAGLLELARFYDQRQEVLRSQAVDANGSEVDGANVLTSPFIQEQAKGFLDYLSVLLTLRQDGGNRRESAENDEVPDAIRVMTVHGSKGLEFPVVYLPGLVQRKFPMQKRAQPAPAPTGMLHPESEGDAAHETGEACLFYVGATRARDHLVLSYSERYGKVNYKRSPYIDALVAGLPEERVMRMVWQESVSGTIPGHSPLGRGPASPLPYTKDDSSPPAYGRGEAGPRPDDLPSSQPSEEFVAAMQPATLNASALETYQTCPRRYVYSHIYRFQLEEGAYQLFWQATKKTLETILMQYQDQSREKDENGSALVYGRGEDVLDKSALYSPRSGTERMPIQSDAQELYSQHWRELGGHEFPFAAIYEQHGREIMKSIEHAFVYSRGEAGPRPGTSFMVEVAGKTIQVEVDHVEVPAQPGEPAKLVRRRVGKRKEKPTASTRELLYVMGYRQQYPGQHVELQEHNLSTSQRVVIKLTEKKEQSLYEELEKSIRGLERQEFPPKPDPFYCPTCPFFLICPA